LTNIFRQGRSLTEYNPLLECRFRAFIVNIGLRWKLLRAETNYSTNLWWQISWSIFQLNLLCYPHIVLSHRLCC